MLRNFTKCCRLAQFEEDLEEKMAYRKFNNVLKKGFLALPFLIFSAYSVFLLEKAVVDLI